MRKFNIVILFCFLSVFPLNANEIDDQISKEEIMEQSTVSIIHYKKADALSCSGSVLLNTEELAIVLSADHCVTDNGSTYVNDIRVVKTYTDKKNDLAIFILNKKIKNKTAITISKKLLEYGDKVHIFGYPEEEKYYNFGYYIKKRLNRLVFRGYAISGVSGGPLFNDDIELVGVVVAKFSETNEIGLAVTMNYVLDFIESTLKEFEKEIKE